MRAKAEREAEELIEATTVLVSPDRVEIEVPNPLRMFPAATGLRIDAEVPTGTVLDLAGGSGCIEAQGRYASASVRTGSGALRLEQAIEARGFEVFIDRHDILPGEDWQALLYWVHR